ncbi:hypothetical protein [Marinomonas sp. PE14-40]|uniref:hypothetical protein n=1 Tax=Marinomonas sp. PE14-40 TaxID=3060621 RepID=UPI003F678DD7
MKWVWKDPVWSKVIAQVITWGGGIIIVWIGALYLEIGKTDIQPQNNFTENTANIYSEEIDFKKSQGDKGLGDKPSINTSIQEDLTDKYQKNIKKTDPCISDNPKISCLWRE